MNWGSQAITILRDAFLWDKLDEDEASVIQNYLTESFCVKPDIARGMLLGFVALARITNAEQKLTKTRLSPQLMHPMRRSAVLISPIDDNEVGVWAVGDPSWQGRGLDSIEKYISFYVLKGSREGPELVRCHLGDNRYREWLLVDAPSPITDINLGMQDYLKVENLCGNCRQDTVIDGKCTNCGNVSDPIGG